MRTPRSPRVLRMIAVGIVVLLSAGCGGPASRGPTGATSATGGSGTGSGTGSTGSGPAPQGPAAASGSGAAPAPVTPTATPSTRRAGSNVLVGSDDNFCAVIAAEWGALSGRTVTLNTGAMSVSAGAGSPAAAVRGTLADFSSCTGVTVTVTADPDLDQHLAADALNNAAPDLAVIQGPALLARLAASGTLVPGPRLVQADLDKLWDPGWRSAGTVDGVLDAQPLDVAAQGLVWYSPKQFEAWGYRVPTSWTALVALARSAVRSGHGWCPATDSGRQVGEWLAEVMLRQAGTQAYDAWTAGTLPFSDPTVRAALSEVGTLLGLPAGPGSAGTPAGTGEAADALVAGSCALALGDQDWPAESSSSASVGPGGDLYAFAIPPITARSGTPLRVRADLLVAFDNRPEVQALRYYLSTAHWAGALYAGTGLISANRGLEVTDVADPVGRLVVTLLQDKTAVSRFDPFTVMPPAVVAAASTQLAAWAAGEVGVDQALDRIAQAWPAS